MGEVVRSQFVDDQTEQNLRFVAAFDGAKVISARFAVQSTTVLLPVNVSAGIRPDEAFEKSVSVQLLTNFAVGNQHLGLNCNRRRINYRPKSIL